VEPIQGETGVYVPSEIIFSNKKALCEAHNVLFMG
jgi:ornithine--oxo-acid transaminase